MKIFKLVFTALIFYSCNAQTKQPALVINKNDNSLLWEISGNGLQQSSYLFGTFHLMCKNDIFFSPQLKTALHLSDKVYMEMDMDDPATIFGGILLMNMKDDKTLQQLYTPSDYKKVQTYFKDSLHTPMSFIEKMKPFFLEAMLYPKMMPCKTLRNSFLDIENILLSLFSIAREILPIINIIKKNRHAACPSFVILK